MPRLAVTLTTLAALALVGVVTRSAFGHELGRGLFEQFGFAPADGLGPAAGRILSSALLTSTGDSFWVAVFAIATLCGYIEWRWGHGAALLAFWGSHVLTLLVTTAPVMSITWFDAHLAKLLFTARDVGPSAGYAGCVGWIVARQPGRRRVVLLGIALAVLGVALARSLAAAPTSVLEVSAALSHAVALPTGVLLGYLLMRERTALPAPAAVAETDS